MEERNDNNFAQQYIDLVQTKLKAKVEAYLNVDKIKKTVIKERITEVQNLYSELFKIQYNISKVDSNKVLKYKKQNSGEEVEVFAYVIDAQAKNWLSRLSAILNILTIKVSEFDVKNSIRRDILFATTSFILGVIITLIIDCCNDRYLEENIKQRIITHDSIVNKILNENISNIDTLKLQSKQQSTDDSVIDNKLNTIIEQNKKIIEKQSKNNK
jgi:ABC-type multidrug transport system fused ATPase/permease subunit